MSFAPNHILVPVAIDSKEDFYLAEYAVEAACDIAEKFVSHITLLHLSPPVILGSGPAVDVSGQIYQSMMDILKARLARGRRKLEELEEEAVSRGITVESRLVESFEDIASVIMDTAQKLNVDLLVMGSHGRMGLSKMLFGSVAEKVATKASMPVLLVHHKKV